MIGGKLLEGTALSLRLSVCNDSTRKESCLKREGEFEEE